MDELNVIPSLLTGDSDSSEVKLNNTKNFGGRDSDGYIVPRLQGWLNVRRLTRKLGVFSSELYGVILHDAKQNTHKYSINEYN